MNKAIIPFNSKLSAVFTTAILATARVSNNAPLDGSEFCILVSLSILFTSSTALIGIISPVPLYGIIVSEGLANGSVNNFEHASASVTPLNLVLRFVSLNTYPLALSLL